MFSRADPEELDQNVFSVTDEQWMLVTAGTVERCNTMTASRGGLDALWGKPVAMVYIRPQRHTLEFMEREDYSTPFFFGEEYRKALTLCDSKSGRNVNKVRECGFTATRAVCGAPYFEEAGLALVCKKVYWRDMDPTHFLDGELGGKWYPEKDYRHTLIRETVKVLKKN